MDSKPAPSASGFRSSRQITVMDEAQAEDMCWICLDTAADDAQLIHPCACPSWTHAACIARWQLQNAGSRRETHCDFCDTKLASWKDILTPQEDTSVAPAVMNVNFDNKTFSFAVAPGADGYRQFTEAIRKAFDLPEDSELNITFTCDEPCSGALLTLSGAAAYDAAVHCAAVSAARRTSLDPAGWTPSAPGAAPTTQPPCAPQLPHCAAPAPLPATHGSGTGSSSGSSSRGISPHQAAGDGALHAGSTSSGSSSRDSQSQSEVSDGEAAPSQQQQAHAWRASSGVFGRRAAATAAPQAPALHLRRLSSLGSKVRSVLSHMLPAK